MIIKKLISCLAFFLICVSQTTAVHAASDETSDEYSFKMSVERHLESKLNSVLRDVTGINQLIAIVKVDVQKQEKKRKPTLPGIPTIKGPDYFGDSDSKSNMIVQKLNVKILVDRDVSKELTDLIHNVAISLVGYDPDRGDTLVVENFEFMKGNSGMASILQPPHIYYVLMAIPIVVFLVAASMFFFNPYRNLKVSLQEIGVVSKSSPEERGASSQPLAPVIQNMPGDKGHSKHSDGDSSVVADDRLFGFLVAHKISDILFALKDMDPEEIAIALNYMDSALAAEVISGIDEETRKVAVEKLIETRQLDQDTVKALEEKLKLKLTFRAGGDDKLASILENTDENLRDSLMDSIEQRDSSAASRLGDRIRTFESVIRKAKPASIDALVRQISPQVFARILASSPGDVQSKVIDSLGTGVAELLKEELKYAKSLSGARLRSEKRRIVEEFNTLAYAGVIDESLEEDA